VTTSHPPATRDRRDDITLEIPLGDAPRASTPDRCTLTVLAGPAAGTVVVIDRPSFVIGRADTADMRIDDPGISREHVRLSRVGANIQVADIHSRNGATVDGERLRGSVVLHDGARLRLGQGTLIRVEIHDALEQETARRLYESGVRDPLTRLYNRRYLDERLTAEVAYAIRHKSPLSLLMVDLDHFKAINDDARFGHAGGDAVLRVVAATLARLVRTEDLVARFGGEELVVVARSTTRRNAEILCERIRRAVEGLAIPWDQHTIRVTASLGVATLDDAVTCKELSDLFRRADDALYRAKRGGRNRVVVAD
jgi:two-component system cell cycle response regulator